MLTVALVTAFALGSFMLVGAGFFTLTGDDC
jgi:hypothetical protein